jgi:hypothetical protein
MVVYGGKIDAGCIGYLPEGCAWKALLAKQALSSIQDPIAGDLWLCCHLKRWIETIVLNNCVKHQFMAATSGD